MNAMLCEEPGSVESGPLRAAEVDEPAPRRGQVRVRVRCCAVCRTDLHVVEGDLPWEKMPIIPGHQVVGIVDRLGEGCTRLRVGQRVGIAWLGWTCGVCEFCRAG